MTFSEAKFGEIHHDISFLKIIYDFFMSLNEQVQFKAGGFLVSLYS